MLMMVMANPIQFTIVSAVPLDAGFVCFATIVLNKGESAMTTIPQNNIKTRLMNTDACPRIKGDKRQQSAEQNKALAAIDRSPILAERKPLATQAGPPIAMTRKLTSDIWID